MDDIEIREKVAKCTRILTMQGLLGLFGHISIYQAETRRVFISPGFGHNKATTQPKDVLVCDLEGRVLEGDTRLPLEWPIHTTLHAARSDAGSVFHLHSPYATAYAIADREFRPVTLQGTIFEDGVPLFTEPQLVKTKELGNKLTELIGLKRAVFLRGHGVAVVGINIEEALYSSLILENDARMAMRASPLGELNSFSPEDCRIFGAEGSWPRWSSLAWAYFEQVEARWDRQPGTGIGTLA